jgi:hypothetical protein
VFDQKSGIRYHSFLVAPLAPRVLASPDLQTSTSALAHAVSAVQSCSVIRRFTP